jgi:DNA-directed RNA polymerase subunit L
MKISKINYPYKDSWDIRKNYMTFDLEGVDNTVANAIRRIVLTDIKYIGFKTRPYEESDINMVINETTMDNQKLTHRIGLIPINIEYPEQFDVKDYQFYIDKKNTGNEIIEVTSKDFKIKKLSTNKDLSPKETESFFPSNPLTGEWMFICYLMPDKTGNGDKGGKLYFTAKASLKTARSDAKYNVAQISFINKQDSNAVEKAWKEYYEANKDSGEPKSSLENRFRTTDALRHYYTDEFGHPNKFEFFIESYVVLRPMVILYKALEILLNKLINLNNNLKSGNYEKVDVYSSETDMNAFDVLINNETYTVAALLQSYILKYFGELKELVTYVGFAKPHPLKDNILLRIALNEGQNNKENVVKVIDKTIEQLTKVIRVGLNQVAKDNDVVKYLKGTSKSMSKSVSESDKEESDDE